jgi:hypothetical protein
MDDIIRWKVNGSILNRSKLLVWLENTYKHKKKKKKKRMGRVGVRSKRVSGLFSKEKGRESIYGDIYYTFKVSQSIYICLNNFFLIFANNLSFFFLSYQPFSEHLYITFYFSYINFHYYI